MSTSIADAGRFFPPVCPLAFVLVLRAAFPCLLLLVKKKKKSEHRLQHYGTLLLCSVEGNGPRPTAVFNLRPSRDKEQSKISLPVPLVLLSWLLGCFYRVNVTREYIGYTTFGGTVKVFKINIYILVNSLCRQLTSSPSVKRSSSTLVLSGFEQSRRELCV